MKCIICTVFFIMSHGCLIVCPPPKKNKNIKKLFCSYIMVVNNAKDALECLLTAVCLYTIEDSKKTCNWEYHVSRPSSPLGSSWKHLTNCKDLVAGSVCMCVLGGALLQETLETNLIPKTCKMTASRCTAEVDLTLNHDTLFNHGPRGMASR